jgi:hypothetical protein
LTDAGFLAKIGGEPNDWRAVMNQTTYETTEACSFCGEDDHDAIDCDLRDRWLDEADREEERYGVVCPECDMDGGEHFRSCMFHRDGLI